MEKIRSLEHLKVQVTVVRWQLDAAASGNEQKKHEHLDGAALAYQDALELLSRLALTDDEHAAVTKELAELSQRLRAAGRSV